MGPHGAPSLHRAPASRGWTARPSAGIGQQACAPRPDTWPPPCLCFAPRMLPARAGARHDAAVAPMFAPLHFCYRRRPAAARHATQPCDWAAARAADRARAAPSRPPRPGWKPTAPRPRCPWHCVWSACAQRCPALCATSCSRVRPALCHPLPRLRHARFRPAAAPGSFLAWCCCCCPVVAPVPVNECAALRNHTTTAGAGGRTEYAGRAAASS